MLIHTVGGNRESPREIKPGQNLCGVGITRFEMTFEDIDQLDHPKWFEWFNNVILVRLVPEEGVSQHISDEVIRFLGKAGVFNTENLAYLSDSGTDEEKAVASRILKALSEKPATPWTWE